MTIIEIYNMICMKKNSAICDLKYKQKLYAELPKEDPKNEIVAISIVELRAAIETYDDLICQIDSNNSKNEIVARSIVELRAAIETYDDLICQINSNNSKSWDCCCGKEENNE